MQIAMPHVHVPGAVQDYLPDWGLGSFPKDMIETRRVKVRRPNTRSFSSVAGTSMSLDVPQFAGFFVGSPGLVHAAAHTGLFEDSLL